MREQPQDIQVLYKLSASQEQHHYQDDMMNKQQQQHLGRQRGQHEHAEREVVATPLVPLLQRRQRQGLAGDIAHLSAEAPRRGVCMRTAHTHTSTHISPV